MGKIVAAVLIGLAILGNSIADDFDCYPNEIKKNNKIKKVLKCGLCTNAIAKYEKDEKGIMQTYLVCDKCSAGTVIPVMQFNVKGVKGIKTLNKGCNLNMLTLGAKTKEERKQEREQRKQESEKRKQDRKQRKEEKEKRSQERKQRKEERDQRRQNKNKKTEETPVTPETPEEVPAELGHRYRFLGRRY